MEFEHIDNIDLKKLIIQDFDDALFLGEDPGIGCLLDITDGITHLKYTSGKRNSETLHGVRIVEQNKKRNKYIVKIDFKILDEPLLREKSSMEDIETIYLSKYSSKSCLTSVFGNYLQRRNIIENDALECYTKPLFRQNKFLTFSKTKSSEDKFLNTIVPFFKSTTIEDKLPFWMTSEVKS